MGWKASGDERAKSYQVYKDLHRAFHDLQRDYDLLSEKLRAKDETLMRLSKELYEALHSSQPQSAKAPSVPVPEASSEQRTPIPEHRPSAVVTRGNLPMSELLSEPKKQKEG